MLIEMEDVEIKGVEALAIVACCNIIEYVLSRWVVYGTVR